MKLETTRINEKQLLEYLDTLYARSEAHRRAGEKDIGEALFRVTNEILHLLGHI
jgi:hypothetical protein